MNKSSIEVTRDWASSKRKASGLLKVTTYTKGVANKEKTYKA